LGLLGPVSLAVGQRHGVDDRSRRQTSSIAPLREPMWHSPAVATERIGHYPRNVGLIETLIFFGQTEEVEFDLGLAV
jgi:hypothetical protein